MGGVSPAARRRQHHRRGGQRTAPGQLALVTQVARHAATDLDIYIVVLLTFGGYYPIVPIFVWRALTCFDPFLDPSRWPALPEPTIYSTVQYFVLAVLAAFQVWFWGVRVRSGHQQCDQYGFFFARVRLNGVGFVTFNILLNVALLIVWLVTTLVDCDAVEVAPSKNRQRQRQRSYLLRLRYVLLGYMSLTSLCLLGPCTSRR